MIRFASILFFWMFFIGEVPTAKLSDIELILYRGPSINNYTSVKVEVAYELCGKLNNSRPTVVYVFGWLGRPKTPSTQAVVEAYLSRGDHNVIVFNWETISVNEVIYVVRSAESVGYTLAMALNELVACGVNPTSLHIVGHSLGSQICGFAGRNVNFTLEKIVGLDPTGIGFYFAMEHLSYKDAEFVIIFHTDRLIFGTNLQTGHVDFYSNNGFNVQPGCTPVPLVSHACSHYKAAYLYAQSVHNESSFLGYACDSYYRFKTGECNLNPTALMGYATPTYARGNFYLDISSEPLYGQGKNYTVIQELIPTVESLLENSYLRNFFSLLGLL